MWKSLENSFSPTSPRDERARNGAVTTASRCQEIQERETGVDYVSTTWVSRGHDVENCTPFHTECARRVDSIGVAQLVIPFTSRGDDCTPCDPFGKAP